MNKIANFIDGNAVVSQANEWIDVTNPANNDLLGMVPLTPTDEIQDAIEQALNAQMHWKEVAISERARLMLRYQHLLKERHDEIATLLSKETGKTLADAKGDVWRGIEVVEQAANIASNMMGETAENVATDIDSYSLIQPSVCAVASLHSTFLR
ncbi:methylmalonate-semialdehyde dehydrogenase [Vibrio maritimus]|uniref:Methylmalonate-semialdehyde dehydrogenase n=1 Tax=Vibrio maritimus TaxID=990268 RepID=A0A090T157_9VIBR|nr:methylmalonate-semialdehyde dehydrogenase [Vibrio maritimus]